MAEEYIIGNNAQFNENVDILGKLNLFDDINTKNIKISGTTDITGDLNASSGIFSGFLSATNVSVAQSVTANEYYGTFKGSIDPSVANDKITEGNTSAEVVDSGSDGHFKVLTEGTERLRIESGGNVDIKSGIIKLGSGSNRRLMYRTGENDVLLEADSGDFYRQDIANSTHGFFTDSVERLRITTRGDIAFNRVGMSTAVGNSDTQVSTTDPKRFIFNSDYSSGYTDASLKLYLFNHNNTRHGFTSGPDYDLQYHASGSNVNNTNLSTSKHTFYKENKKQFQIGYKSSTGENVIGHVGLTTGTSKLAWGNPAGDDYRLNTSGGAELVFGVDGDNEFFAVEGHLTGQRHVEYMRISKEGYMTKPYQPSFLVAAGRAGDGFTDTPYQFRTAVRNVDSAFKMTSGTGQYSYYIVPITGLYLFTTHAAYQQSGVSFNTRIHRYNSAGAVQEVLELHRNVGFSGSHAGGAGSCMMYCTTGDYVYVAPDFTPYHLNTTLNFFAGCLLG